MGMPLPLLKLPPLDLIRGFVAVGRRMSITLAAQDLCLTQSAVSRQVHALEEQVGTPLLLRGYRSIRFTPAGERLFRSADGAVQQLQDVLGELRADDTPQPVTLSATIGVTGLWLLPRLSRFQQQHPGVDLRVSANNQLADLRHDGIDLAIRYTTSAAVPPGSSWLFGESVAPVAHPRVAAALAAAGGERPALLELDDTGHPWLRWPGWRDWLDALGFPAKRGAGVLHFNQYDQVIQAALDGQGLALGRMGLIQPLLAAGRLQLLAAPRQMSEAEHAYWLVCASERPRAEVTRVAEWIVAEARLAAPA